MCYPILKGIHITRFRRIHDLDINLNAKVTAFIGQNGTMKTTLLGIIAHPFSMNERTDSDSGTSSSLNVEKTSFPAARTLSGTKFESKFADKFKIDSKREHAGEHEWTLLFSDTNIGDSGYFTVESIPRPGGKLRFWKKGTHEKGSGYIQYPVIYLSLKRVSPIGEEKKISDQSASLSDEEKELLNKYYRNILILDEDCGAVDDIKSSNKKALIAHPDSYSAQSVSAGQDNLGSILTAVLSFRRLQKDFPHDYKGGLLFIDEIESTLYPAAQAKLVECLYKFSSKFHIQIFLTTHSSTVIKKLMQPKYKGDTRIIFLESKDKQIVQRNNLDLDTIDNLLNVTPTIKKKKLLNKINLYTEDDEARMFLQAILPYKYKILLNWIRVNIGAEELKGLVKVRKIPEFTDNLIILDGDKASKKGPKNIIYLPGKGVGPDHLLYDYLRSLSDSDAFWSDNYNKQMCFNNFLSFDGNDGGRAREHYKNWFKSQIDFWGAGGLDAFKQWKTSHKDEVALFLEQFVKTYNYLAKRKGLETIE